MPANNNQAICPYCGEGILTTDNKCRHCAMNLNETIAISRTPHHNKKMSGRNLLWVVATLMIIVLVAGLFYGAVSIGAIPNIFSGNKITEPAGDPKVLLNEYYQDIADSNHVSAYNVLSDVNKGSYTQDEYVLFYRLLNESIQLRSFRITETERVEEYTVDNKIYDLAVKFNVVQTIYDYSTEREVVDTTTGLVVSENENWEHVKILDNLLR